MIVFFFDYNKIKVASPPVRECYYVKDRSIQYMKSPNTVESCTNCFRKWEREGYPIKTTTKKQKALKEKSFGGYTTPETPRCHSHAPSGNKLRWRVGKEERSVENQKTPQTGLIMVCNLRVFETQSYQGFVRFSLFAFLKKHGGLHVMKIKCYSY